MKTLMTAFVLATTVLTAQAHAFGPTMDSMFPDLSFPDQVSEPVSQDKAKPAS
ncbi:hypothetical protein RUESEDTHA_00567 [Ruegeria sp. THAF57]|uniref:hypothetical protein n=1 Tax=Ruegeria sp. THAF57 TaxID=2744555 RepID=UPI0015DF18B7|nr:hypothetical protein [Ruegeria sp. THAF57]CAD0183693.1 hypothetical protein RUESEDTHA_00567 [Ruegeria sp. THAF57]